MGLLTECFPVKMMHKGWLLERAGWEETCRAARSVFGIADAMVHLEDWINLDYPSNSEVIPIIQRHDIMASGVQPP